MSYIEKLESGYWHYRFNRNKVCSVESWDCPHNGRRIWVD